MAKFVRNQKNVNAVKGATPRAYETHPNPNSSGDQKARGTFVSSKPTKAPKVNG